MKIRLSLQQAVFLTECKIEAQTFQVAIGQVVGNAPPVVFQLRSGESRTGRKTGGHLRQMIKSVVTRSFELHRQGTHFIGTFLNRLSA